MRTFKTFVSAAVTIVWATSLLKAAPAVILHNNQSFAIRTPVRLHRQTLGEGSWIGAQQLNNDVVFVAKVPASTTQRIDFIHGANGSSDGLKIEPDASGVKLSCADRELGRLSWELDEHPVPLIKDETNEPTDFDRDFKPLVLPFQETAHGPVVNQWQASAVQNGFELRIELMAYHDGFLDISGHLTNLTADASVRSYAAVVCRWEQPPATGQTLCYDNHIAELGARGLSPDRSGHEGSETYKQHGADWVRTTFQDGTSAGWLNDFAPSFTIVDNTTNNPLHTPRWALANLSQLGQEFQTVPGRLYSITEVARSDTRIFHDRPTENRLPLRGEGVSFASRLLFSPTAMTATDVDHAFVAYTSYNAQSGTPEKPEVSFGTRFVCFGTSYFPYSTLGENFDDLKLPGMDSESFWPLAADTVLQWRLFADDIHRDLRIAKAMGFQLIRLHHLELLGAIPDKTRGEYLDFLFGQLRQLHLRALVDINASPERLTELIGRYRDVIDGVELENEIMIWGIPLDRPPLWKAEYAAIKKAAPEIPVNLTGYNNTGMFNRLTDLGVPFDRVDLHSYIDSVEAIPSARGYALAMGSYATKTGKPPMISEWNWRGLTKMSEEERAKIYPPIIENAVATRAIPDFYQFQFNETLAPNPRLGRGKLLRHYELLSLSRRPKLEALELMKLIERYSAPVDLHSSHQVVELGTGNQGTVAFSVTNEGGAPLNLHLTPETSGGLTAELQTNALLTLPPGQAANIPIAVSLTNRVPGFYHLFVRLESDGGLLHYLWAEIRVPGAPQLEPGAEIKFDFTKPAVVAYRQTATTLEVETAFAIGETLESATGRVVPIEPLESVPDAASAHIIFVGSEKDSPPPANLNRLILSGANSREVEKKSMDFILRYWKFAKDSAARRVGLVRKDLPRGTDASKLP